MNEANFISTLVQVHVQNATLAGGVAIGTAANLMVQPFGAMLVGALAGTLSVIGFHYIQVCAFLADCSLVDIQKQAGVSLPYHYQICEQLRPLLQSSVDCCLSQRSTISLSKYLKKETGPGFILML